MTANGTDAGGASSNGSGALLITHAAVGIWVSWNLIMTTSATFLRLVIAFFSAIPVIGTVMTSVAMVARGDGVWRVIVPIALWTLALMIVAKSEPVEMQESDAPSAPAKPKPKPKPAPKSKPKQKPKSEPKPKPKSEPKPKPSAPSQPASRSADPPMTGGGQSIEPEEPRVRSAPSPRRAPRVRVSRPRGILGEPDDGQFDPSEVALRVQRSGGSGLGKASTCGSCGTGIDIFSGRCGCT